jgi:hypothetical protein
MSKRILLGPCSLKALLSVISKHFFEAYTYIMFTSNLKKVWAQMADETRTKIELSVIKILLITYILCTALISDKKVVPRV